MGKMFFQNSHATKPFKKSKCFVQPACLSAYTKPSFFLCLSVCLLSSHKNPETGKVVGSSGSLQKASHGSGKAGAGGEGKAGGRHAQRAKLVFFLSVV